MSCKCFSPIEIVPVQFCEVGLTDLMLTCWMKPSYNHVGLCGIILKRPYIINHQTGFQYSRSQVQRMHGS